MKKVAIVQSSYIPWIGYFDLIGSVDEFIIYDSMQFTKRDWRNRNLIKTPQGKKWITIPVLSKGKYHQTIFDTKIDGIRWQKDHLKAITLNYARAPFFDEISLLIDPFMSGSCCVIPCEDRWRMWYLSCTEWFRRQDDVIHKYHIKYAESSDGINWNREGIIAIDFKDDDEVAISRPSVILDCGKWKMWFSYRGTSYKIGYAESSDGIHWERQDNLSGIDVSPDGWDSESVEYPYVFMHKDSKYMLYNGNNFGKTGLGLAIWN